VKCGILCEKGAGDFGKFVNLARTKNIPFGYIHSTNIDAAISSIYKDYQ